MRYAIISDIHSNLEALESVLGDMAHQNCGEVISLGDTVGYGGNPNECVELIRGMSVTSIIGNHDKVALGVEEPWNFNPVAREAALWTRDELSPGNKEHLASLPESEDYGNFIIVHGALSDPDKYILGRHDAEPEFDLLGDRELCFFGHTHVAAAYARKDSEVRNINVSPDKEGLYIQIEKQMKYLINPGSVGQPRDRDPRASYIVYDTEGTVEFRRVAYDIESAQKKILDAGLNNMLAERLSYGF